MYFEYTGAINNADINLCNVTALALRILISIISEYLLGYLSFCGEIYTQQCWTILEIIAEIIQHKILNKTESCFWYLVVFDSWTVLMPTNL